VGHLPAVLGKEAIAGAVAAISVGMIATPATATGCVHSTALTTALSDADRRAALVCVVSAERAARGLAPVRENAQLTLAAQRHADDMVTRRFFSHVTPGGTTLGERARVTGYMQGRRDWELGEVLAWAQEPLNTAEGLVRAWLDSLPHQAILLDGRFREVGVGVTAGLTDGTSDAGATAVLDFGFRSASPTLPKWRTRSATACARTARASRPRPARCASTSKRSKHSSQARPRSSTRSATTSKA
jgi:uncharacterized protein YkwD